MYGIYGVCHEYQQPVARPAIETKIYIIIAHAPRMNTALRLAVRAAGFRGQPVRNMRRRSSGTNRYLGMNDSIIQY
jgi:hypothetical protein